MSEFAFKNVLHRHQAPTPGKAVTDSRRFPGHEERMAAHINRIRNHPCERTDGRKCKDCIKGKV